MNRGGRGQLALKLTAQGVPDPDARTADGEQSAVVGAERGPDHTAFAAVKSETFARGGAPEDDLRPFGGQQGLPIVAPAEDPDRPGQSGLGSALTFGDLKDLDSSARVTDGQLGIARRKRQG